eukprot:CAMPEP_0202348988 /NCGR_PEP_ID=MMETSP1126-20121109/6672_1 /ASSEMBLY_ACC=CAM_ASM_000457 /TAXON_ID=3047 /ORGANISM="Dunaliella tertiolecta, Strain CCMP1320" /LENGTH=90 /DNA_ID=CAMNT_0048940733 /DNA_START=114 /DNA_END=386 /DNA_ORIENTATION=+
MGSALSPEMLRLIKGEVTEEEKAANYDSSLERWWTEYAARKNDEDQEHVADSLLYDERCHLPRTAPRPTYANNIQNSIHKDAPQQNGAAK